jgi:fatty-acyl-CoA synthase
MTGWNFADALEAVAAARPDAHCMIQGDRVATWRKVNARANRLATDLLAAGLGRQSRVAVALRNRPEYVESYLAAFNAALVPVNTKYRYGADELRHLWSDAGAEAVVFGAELADRVDAVRSDLPGVQRWYAVADGTRSVPDWAVPYEAVAGAEGGQDDDVRGPWGRSGDDLLFLYTGGTTGRPKGVMWRQDDVFAITGAGGNVMLGVEPPADLAELARRSAAPAVAPAASLPASPLMHGTGLYTSLSHLCSGGRLVLLTGRGFDPAELWDAVDRHRVELLVVVGMAFALPMVEHLEHLERHGRRYDLDCVRVVTSSGVMLSEDVKQRLLAFLPNAIVYDSLGSSEAPIIGRWVSQPGRSGATARFELADTTRVLGEDGRWVDPAVGGRGLLAARGRLSLGYHDDPDASARVYRVIDGERWCIPGDWADLDPVRGLTLLGRDSVVINTGGEKVHAEEVEEAVKTSPAVRDALVVGVPDTRFGQIVAAVVELASPVDGDPTAAVAAHVKGRLAAYKAPRLVVPVDRIVRGPNGKADYRWARDLAAAARTEPDISPGP